MVFLETFREIPLSVAIEVLNRCSCKSVLKKESSVQLEVNV